MIHLSPSAIGEISRIKSNHSNPEAFIRVGVQTGGCAGFYYTMELDEEITPDDQRLVCNGLQIVVKSQTLKYLDGLTLDYSEDLMGGGFRFHNPNASQPCGCGNSFSILEL